MSSILCERIPKQYVEMLPETPNIMKLPKKESRNILIGYSHSIYTENIKNNITICDNLKKENGFVMYTYDNNILIYRYSKNDVQVESLDFDTSLIWSSTNDCIFVSIDKIKNHVILDKASLFNDIRYTPLAIGTWERKNDDAIIYYGIYIVDELPTLYCTSYRVLNNVSSFSYIVKEKKNFILVNIMRETIYSLTLEDIAEFKELYYRHVD